MRRLVIALLSAIPMISVLPITQASAALAGPSSRTVASTHAPTLRLVNASAWRHITLSPRECAAMKLTAGRCPGSESLQLTRVAATDTTNYWSGHMQACAVVYSSGGCQTSTWWVTDSFNFTTDVDNGDTWNNGTPQCAANHTNITWCSYVSNGTVFMQEGFNFGNGGYARMYPGVGCEVTGPSWEHLSGYDFDFATANGEACQYYS